MIARRLLRTVCLICAAMSIAGPAIAADRVARPNILFFFPDQHRSDWTSMNPRLPDITPNLKKLAQSGVHFTNALSPSPVCAPARACLASGREYANCRVSSNGVPYPLDQTTMYSLLRNAGYQVLGCGKFDLDKPGGSWGIDGKHRRPGEPSLLEVWGFTDGIDNAGKMDGVNAYKPPRKPEPYFAFLESRNLVDAFLKNYRMLDHDYPGDPVLPDDAYCDTWIAGNGLALIRAIPPGQPWFLQVNFNGPHSPMDVTKSMYERWKDAEFPQRQPSDARNNAAERRNYGAMIHNIDRWLGVFMEELRSRGELENTLIVYCSDHGEMLGDHGMGGKSQPYHPSACVPLVIAGPGIRKNVVCDRAVETLDLTATFLDCASVAPAKDTDSRSMCPFLKAGDNLPRPYATSSLGGWSLVFDGRYKLIAGKWAKQPKQEGTAEADALALYDLQVDPIETNNIADQHPDLVARLKPLLPPVAPYKEVKKGAKADGKKGRRR
ncbi:MAG TPA: sulfatase-like hydrolase/transferase [Thermoguttaceae bacterium]|nr:sulfatase-like hydrolase/transferase [Thermoguttaceae bacterium]